MNEHLGYEKYERSSESNYRTAKRLRKSGENTAKWTYKFHRTETVPLSLESYQNEKRHFSY